MRKQAVSAPVAAKGSSGWQDWVTRTLQELGQASYIPTLGVDVTSPFNAVAVQKGFTLAAPSTPAQVTANQNNYSPADLAATNVLRVSTDASRTLTGLLAPALAGQTLLLMNVGSFPLVLSDEDLASTAANRFALDGNVTLAAGTSVWLFYDGTLARWTTPAQGGISGSYQPLDADLTALAALASTGLVARTGTATYAERTLTAPAAGLTITNPAGIAGNPAFALANDLAAIEALSSTGFAARTTTDTWAQRTITAGASIGVTNGDGASGDPTIAVTDNELVILAGLTAAADKVPYFTGASTGALMDFTSVARTLVGQSTQALMRTTGLGLGTAATEATGASGHVLPFLDAANTWSAAQTFAAVPLFSGGSGGSEGGQIALLKPPSGTTLAADVIIDIISNSLRIFEGGGTLRGVTLDLSGAAASLGSALWHSGNLAISANGLSLVTAANYAAMRALLDLEVGTDFLSPAAIAAAYLALAGGTMAGALVSAGSTGAIAVLSPGTMLEARATSGAGNAALMTFHRPGAFAAALGIDTDNKFKIGGWSYGAVAYEIWHAGNNATMKASADLEVGVDLQAYDADLTALAALATTGIVARTGAATYTPRTITGTAPIVVTNGDGVSGAPAISASAASTSASGVAELATSAETLAGTDTERVVTPAGLRSLFYKSDIQTIADDGVATLTVPVSNGAIGMLFNNNSAQISGLFKCRPGATANGASAISLIGATFGYYATTLAGTTGTDTQFNIGVTSGRIDLENRTGSTKAVTLLLFTL